MPFERFIVGSRRAHRVMTVLPLALSLGSAASSSAQQPNCLEVKAQVASDTIEVRHRSAWGALHACGGDIEAGAITSLLRRALPNSRAENDARYAAMYLADRRLLDSVRVLAVDATRSVDQRMWDLNLLIHYVDRYSGLTSADTGAIGVVDGVPSDTPHIWGDEPPQEEDRARALATIVRMGRKDPDPKLRRLAERAAEELGYSPKKCPPASLVDLPAQWLCSALEELPK